MVDGFMWFWLCGLGKKPPPIRQGISALAICSRLVGQSSLYRKSNSNSLRLWVLCCGLLPSVFNSNLVAFCAWFTDLFCVPSSCARAR